MRVVEYTILGMGGEKKVSGSVLDLLKSIPYFLMTYIPTRVVMNSVLEKGFSDAGMSGGARWPAFKLSADEYELVASHLELKGLKRLSTPSWVSSESDWGIWKYEVDHAVPSKEHRRLSAICDDIDKKLIDAEDAGRTEEAEDLHWKYVEADTIMRKFIDEHFKR